MQPLDLFTYPMTAGSKGGGASAEAAALIDKSGKGLTVQQAIMRHLKRGHVHTAEEISNTVGHSVTSVRSRLSELMQCGLVEKLELRGEAVSGVKIHKWRVIE